MQTIAQGFEMKLKGLRFRFRIVRWRWNFKDYEEERIGWIWAKKEAEIKFKIVLALDKSNVLLVAHLL